MLECELCMDQFPPGSIPLPRLPSGKSKPTSLRQTDMHYAVITTCYFYHFFHTKCINSLSPISVQRQENQTNCTVYKIIYLYLRLKFRHFF